MERRFDHRGFTQVELIVVIAITGLLAAVAIPRFVARDSFDSRGFHDESHGVVRFAQKTAIAWRRTISVCVTGISVSAHSGAVASCSPLPAILPHPATGGDLRATAPAGVTLSPVLFSFDGMGRPSAGTTIAFTSTVPGDPSRQIVIEAETGYVHP